MQKTSPLIRFSHESVLKLIFSNLLAQLLIFWGDGGLGTCIKVRDFRDFREVTAQKNEIFHEEFLQ